MKIKGMIMMNDTIAANAQYSKIEVLNQSWTGGAVYSYKKKKRPHWGICFIADGEVVYKTEKLKIAAKKGDVVVLKKDASYSAEFTMYTDDILINLQCSNDFAADEKNDITIIRDCKNLRDDFIEILNYAEFKERSCMVKSVFYRILDGITKSEAETALSAKIKKIINSDTEFAKNEADIAKACSVSVSTLQRTFKEAYAKNISEYKNDIRMAKAKRLLLSGMYSVEKIAEMLNFCDCAYFSRCFKKSVGMSPKKFIKQAYII